MPGSTRDRIIEAGAALFRRQGYTATGLKQIARNADAPFGSIYHFFPGGKDELTAEIIRVAGRGYGALVPLIFDPAPDIATATRNFFLGAAMTLENTDFADACPIETIALEVASTNETLRVATAEVFGEWIDELDRRYVAAGIAAARARELAITAVALLEGAFVLVRSLRDTRPLQVSADLMASLIREAISQARQVS